MLFLLALLLAPESRGALVEKLLVTPGTQGRREFVAAIGSAKKSVHLEMYHLTDPEVVEALERKARTVADVKVLLDGAGLKQKAFRKVFDQLKIHGVSVKPSSPAFRHTHTKSLVVDGELALITAINLTKKFGSTRDFGVVTRDKAVIGEMESVFAADWENADKKSGDTPALSVESLVWSPVSSEAKLVRLLDSAKKTVVAQVENLGDREIEEAFERAAARGAQVRLLVPMCDKNPDPLFNYPSLGRLAGKGVSVRVMPWPDSPKHPYMHSKMIVADSERVYIGSVNFSNSSARHNRELGIVFPDARVAAEIGKTFDEDWASGVAPPSPPPSNCPVVKE